MKTLLVGINAKYIHTNLAIRNLAAYCKQDNLIVYEATINDNMDDILEDIMDYNADLIGFSCYLWNIEDVLDIAENIKKIKSETVIILGGPEVSYEVEDLLKEKSYIDYVIINEGEERFQNLLQVLKGNRSIESVDGLAYRADDNIIVNLPKDYVDLNDIPFSYNDEDLEHKLVYYETSRGCLFRCAFCLSSLENDVRTADLEKVKRDLLQFTKMGVKVVKLVDRSFNCNLVRALDLLDIIRQLPGDTVIHCEINPELVNDDFVRALEGLEGRLQFEVGIQSTNPETLREISRTPDVKRSLKGIERLKTTGIKLHVDLIAGLPYESFERFSYSFDDVYNLYPEEIQLGFLKLLKGTRLRKDANKYGIVYRSRPPYEILYTKDINYRELCILTGIARLLDKYYNTCRFEHSLAYLSKRFNRPFDFFLIISSLMIVGCSSPADNNSDVKESSSGDAKIEKVFKIGISQFVEHPALDGARQGFIDGLKEAGFEEGKNVDILLENAQADFPTTQTIANKLITENVDLILAIATPSAQSAANATKDIPILITAVTDPVEAGLVKSLEKSETNVTGTTDMNPVHEQLELLKEILPQSKNVGVIYNAAEPNSVIQVDIAKEAAENMGLTILEATVANSGEVNQAVQSLAGKVDAIYTPTDNTVASAISAIVKVANDANIPVIGSERGQVEGGAVATLGIDYYLLGKQTGFVAAKVLKGEDPEGIPIEGSKDLKLIINKKSANILGLTIPEQVLSRADEILEQ